MSRSDILMWVHTEIRNGKNDTIHDFLAFLAGQMIELNKTKNQEVKGFLKWLEREMGCDIDDLTGKTILKNYHRSDLLELLAVLKKNKSKLSVDPTNRRFQESLERHFEESMVILKPLKEKIQLTDNLIDQIVYKMYELTDEEIAIVEGKR